MLDMSSNIQPVFLLGIMVLPGSFIKSVVLIHILLLFIDWFIQLFFFKQRCNIFHFLEISEIQLHNYLK